MSCGKSWENLRSGRIGDDSFRCDQGFTDSLTLYAP